MMIIRALPVRGAAGPRGLFVVILALWALVGHSGFALAIPQLHPSHFALAPAAFPPGSKVVRAGIESNYRLLRDDQLHFGFPPAAAGRLTGYYVDAVEGSPTSSPRVYTSYLVSIFSSAHQADLAFELRYDNWFDQNYFTSPPPAPVTVGDNGEEALFHTLDSRVPRVSELFFVRGTILVEVFQGTAYSAPSASEVKSFYGIAVRLDQLARPNHAGA